MKSLLNTRLVCVCVLFPLATHSYVFETFDAKVLLDQAPLVCKVKVLSVNRPWFFEKGGSLTARVKCLATIKGISPEEEFEVVSPASTHDGLNSVSYTELERGEVCIVFLHNMTRGTATFEDVHNGKMPGLGEFVPFKLGDTPQDRMLRELLALCKSSKGEIRLLATEYLG
ncbi:MAG: hypothetical protein NTY53_24445, partial [Kiritimatiellaeota bacterium]|nr:hypothetical protein [Kiritimatiellota bacterium]